MRRSEGFVFMGLGEAGVGGGQLAVGRVWRFRKKVGEKLAVGSRQLTEVRGRKLADVSWRLAVKDSMLCAENCSGR